MPIRFTDIIKRRKKISSQKLKVGEGRNVDMQQYWNVCSTVVSFHFLPFCVCHLLVGTVWASQNITTSCKRFWPEEIWKFAALVLCMHLKLCPVFMAAQNCIFQLKSHYKNDLTSSVSVESNPTPLGLCPLYVSSLTAYGTSLHIVSFLPHPWCISTKKLPPCVFYLWMKEVSNWN